MSYTRERDEFIARMVKEGLELAAVRVLLRESSAMQRYAELATSSEAADRDRIPCPATKKPKPGPCLCDRPNDGHETIPRITLQDHRAELRAAAALPAGWQIETQGDPRGYVLRVIPPSYAERNAGRDRFNRDSIGVPSRPSGLRF
jgi:hypothetical protein